MPQQQRRQRLASINQPHQRRLVGVGDVMPTRAVEKIDIANFAKLPSQPLEFGGRLFGVQFLPTRDETLQRFSQRRVILCPRVVEHRDDFLSSESLDFLCTN